jgi:hypothetical protein
MVPAAAPATAAAPPPREDADLPEILPRVRRRSGRHRPDPAYCLNHDTVPSQHKCPDCGESFCADCVLTLQGATLCGPCKNYRVRRLLRPPRMSGFALASVLVAMLTGPLVLCLAALGDPSRMLALILILLVPQIAAFLLGAMGLRTTETDPQRSGRSLAITGMVTAGVACVVTLVVTVFAHRPLG